MLGCQGKEGPLTGWFIRRWKPAQAGGGKTRQKRVFGDAGRKIQLIQHLAGIMVQRMVKTLQIPNGMCGACFRLGDAMRVAFAMMIAMFELLMLRAPDMLMMAEQNRCKQPDGKPHRQYRQRRIVCKRCTSGSGFTAHHGPILSISHPAVKQEMRFLRKNFDPSEVCLKSTTPNPPRRPCP